MEGSAGAQDLAVLRAYVRAVGATMRRRPEPPAEGPAPPIDRDRIRWYRQRTMRLDRRLSAGEHPAAARGGLQDSSPRSGLLSLHARVEGVDPGAWEHPSLVQVWLRWADYLVPRADVAAFTLGTLPREPAIAAALHRLADAVVDALDGRPRPPGAVVAAVPWLPRGVMLYAASTTGRIHIRWDASTIAVRPAEPPAVDPEAARLELARRFLHWHGPAGPAHFAKWAGVLRPDAEATWAALAPELVPVTFCGRRRWLLAADEPALAGATPPRTVRLLPPGDPCLYLDRDLLPLSPTVELPPVGPTVSRRLLNGLMGRVLLDGEVVGLWGRVGADFTVVTVPGLPEEGRGRIASEVEGMAGPLGRRPRLRWLR